MATHAERARRFYGGSDETPKAATTPGPSERAARMYAATRRKGASVDVAVASCFDRLEAKLRDDPERLAQLREDRRAVARVLEERQVSHEDAHAMLGTYYEHTTSSRSPEAIAQRWPSEWERIRLAAGSTEAAEQVLKSADAFYKAIAAAAHRAASA